MLWDIGCFPKVADPNKVGVTEKGHQNTHVIPKAHTGIQTEAMFWMPARLTLLSTDGGQA